MVLFELLKLVRFFLDYLRIEYLWYAFIMPLTNQNGITSRLIAVMLLTIAVGAVYALRYADVSRVMLGVIAVYGFGVTLANLWNILANKPINPSYVVAFGIMFLVSATLLIAER